VKPLDSSILAEFGLVNVHFARLETALSSNTAKLIDPGDSRIGNVVTAGMDMKHLFDLFASLVIHRTPLGLCLPGADEIRKALANLSGTMNKVRETRNIVVHSHWESGPTTANTPAAIRLKDVKNAKWGHETAIETWTVHRLHEFVEEIQGAEEALGEVIRLANKHIGFFPVDFNETSVD